MSEPGTPEWRQAAAIATRLINEQAVVFPSLPLSPTAATALAALARPRPAGARPEQSSPRS